MQPGDMLVFRGDLSHAEVATAVNNVPLHGCVNVDGVDHDEGIVERVACFSVRALLQEVQWETGTA